MKKQTLFLALLLLCSWATKAQSAYPPYDFKAANADGDTLYYRITSSSAPYKVAVTRCMDSLFHSLHAPQSANDVGQSGYAYPLYTYGSLLSIPSEVTHDGITYSVTSVDNEAFYLQRGIRKVVLPTTIVMIDTAAFYISSVSEIIMPNVRQINYGAFTGTPLEQVVLPDTLSWLGRMAFAGCPMNNIDIPCGVSVLQGYTFWNCPLEHIVFHEGLTEIEDFAFRADKIDSIFFPSSLQKLGIMLYDTFFIPLPEIECRYVSFQEGTSPLVLGDHCLAYFKNLRALQLPNNLIALGKSCFELAGLESIIIPEGVTAIPKRCFAGCDSLKSILLPLSLETIDSESFSATSQLSEITIPGQVTQFGMEVFNVGLEHVNIECELPPIIHSNTFPSYPIQFTIPCHTLASYQESPVWSEQGNFSFHEDCTLTEEYERNPIEIYPNPTKGITHVKCNLKNVCLILVYNSLGHCLLSHPVRNECSMLDLSCLPEGYYFLKVIGKQNVENAAKIIKIN